MRSTTPKTTPPRKRGTLARNALMLGMLGAAGWAPGSSAFNPCLPNHEACWDYGFSGCCGGSCTCSHTGCTCVCCG